MLKTLLLSASVLTACAVDETTSEIESAGTCEHDCECTHDCEPPPPPPAGPSCIDNGVRVFLDDAPANVDDNDGKVTYCHATSSARNPYVVITTSVSACFAHTTHVHLTKGGHLDVFGTDGCED